MPTQPEAFFLPASLERVGQRFCIFHAAHQAWLEASEFEAAKQASPAPLSDGEVRTLDQLVFRFGRLQDAMGAQLLPALLQLIPRSARIDASQPAQVGIRPCYPLYPMLRRSDQQLRVDNQVDV